MHDGIPDLLFFFIYAAWNLPSRLQISSNSLSFCFASGLKSSGTCILTTAYWSPWSDGSFKETIPLPRRRIFVPEWVPALILQTTSPYNVWTRGRGERNFHIAVDIHALSRPARSFADCDLKKQITCGTTAASRHSFACKTDALSGLDACRDLYLQGLRPAARLVRVLDRDGLFAAMNGLIEGYLNLRI